MKAFHAVLYPLSLKSPSEYSDLNGASHYYLFIYLLAQLFGSSYFYLFIFNINPGPLILS